MRVETKWAIIIVVLISLWYVVLQVRGFFTTEKIATGQRIEFVLSTLTYIFGYFMVTKEKRDMDYNGVMSWSEGFWTSARMTLFYIVLSSFAMLIYIEHLNPGYKAFITSDNFGKDPVSTFLHGNVFASFVFGGLFCLIFPIFTRRSINNKA